MAQEVIESIADSTRKQEFIRFSRWIPFNAYSIAPHSTENILELSAMPVNWAFGVIFGKSDAKFIRLSMIANWRIEYKMEYEQESFSLERAGAGAMFDYSGLFYAGLVFPIEVSAFKGTKPQLLIGIQLALTE